MHLPAFSLVKWYMDCATESGGAAILYCATLRWRGLRAAMASVLTVEDGRVATRTRVARFRLDADEEELAVEAGSLKVTGRWRADAAPVRRCLYEAETGSVTWNCVQPRSRVAVRVGDWEMTGIGYAERLTVTIPPWKLPMRALRWGRFVSETDSLAWIDWEGGHSARVCVLNGKECELRSVSESSVVLDGATLHMDGSTTLREGRLRETILPGAPGLEKLFPGSVFGITERKWLSRGRLERTEGGSMGNVIHEAVHWGC